MRALLEALDGEVEQVYAAAGLDFRPRYAPIVRRIVENGPCTMRALQQALNVSHSAISQSVSEMKKRDLATVSPGRDGRERLVSLTAKTEALLPQLNTVWCAAEAAAAELDSELQYPLSRAVDDALAALEIRSFRARLIAELSETEEEEKADD